MLDIQLIRQQTDLVSRKLAKKGCNVDFTEFLKLDKERRALIQKTEELKALRNKVSAQIPLMKKNGEDVGQQLAEMKNVAEEVKRLDADLARINEKQTTFLQSLPNLPDDDLVGGGKENNKVISMWGKKPEFDFQPLHHVDIAEKLHLIDYNRGAKMAGSGSWVYTGDGALLEWALLNYFVEQHIADGYTMILPPHMLNYASGYTAGQFPKFIDDVYWLDHAEERSNFMLPTAETALVNLYRDEILDEKELPKRFFAYTPCYRREAGSYRAEERGMIRGHQFNKVEMFQYTTKDGSDAAFEELVGKACKLVEGLGLHYRLSKLAAGDCSASMARTYDIEIWIPSMNDYKEISSVSNARDYQARRGNMRYRDSKTGKIEFVHTLNGSGLATSRVFPAILEQYQTADGKVRVPEVLQKYLHGKTVLG
ncbi:serine--tRNA ligase [Amygdalobacter indicium]|uniref:Serine--tRNA ligase n=1 Tax=Amygdalobacter indicium TaxID=3029272 RepID=A0ABY8C5F9_9FIRM|nr:serine--tRNA ligase [Amygdalobacter indicium]WEG35534.1 serine--tRNA ligase [Amygdalobacter indicium]